MFSNDLRIGNFVLLHGNISEVTALRKLSIYCIYKNKSTSFEISSTYYEIQPIHINSNWLEKLGFKSYKDICYIKENFVILKCGLNNYSFSIINESAEEFLVKKISYIHQLQNLYFALKEKELNLI